MENKKAQMGMIVGIVGLIIVIIITTTATIPAIQPSIQSLIDDEVLEKNSPEDNFTSITVLSSTETLVGITITGLTSPANYTLDIDELQVNWTNHTTADNYTSLIYYREAQYLDSARNRAIMGITVILLGAGLVYLVGRLFGLL